MIDAKDAYKLAKEHAAEMLGPHPFRLEEIERDTYKDRDVWRLTLGYPRDKDVPVSPIRALGYGPVEYKVFVIDANDGGLVAMKLREPALQ